MKHGGNRKGAGRPRNYSEQTKPIRLPLSLIDSVKHFIDNNAYQIPLYHSKVSAGFPAPATDDSTDKLNLHDLLVKDPNNTFLVRVSGLSMLNAGIHENDILIVDRSLAAVPGKIVVAAIDGQLTVKRLQINNNKLVLMPENPDFPVLDVEEESNVHIWGVVTNVIHAV